MTFGNFILLRYEADGSRRDPGFGTAREGGYTITIAGDQGGGAQDLALQRNGRILLAGYGIDAHHRYTAMAAAFDSDGRPDRSFAHAGILKLRPAGWSKGGSMRFVSLKTLADGRILLGGDLNGRIVVLALRPDGRPDRRFGGGDGAVVLDPDRTHRCACSYATDMELDRRGRIVLSANLTAPSRRQPAVLARLRPDGRLDRSFGRRGFARAALGSRLAGKAVAIQGNGRILLAGTYNVPRGGEARVAAVRFRPDGRLDRSFARRGFFTRDFGYEGVAYAALAQRDGRVVIGGRANPKPSHFESPSVYDTAEVFLIRFLQRAPAALARRRPAIHGGGEVKPLRRQHCASG